MRQIESIKMVDGVCLNLEYHSRRAGFQIEQPVVSKEFARGVVKWRILYGGGLPMEQTMSHYKLPTITSLQIVDGTGIDYRLKYEDRRSIESLMQLRGECDDIIILRESMVSDSSFCNLVFESRSALFTPSTPLLSGTKRQMLLDKGVIVERAISVDDIKDFDCVRLINAMIELEDDIRIHINRLCVF